jgi:hypothetical protein
VCHNPAYPAPGQANILTPITLSLTLSSLVHNVNGTAGRDVVGIDIVAVDTAPLCHDWSLCKASKSETGMMATVYTLAGHMMVALHRLVM